MKKILLKASCFITGYNYFIIKNSSQVSCNLVKKYFSAILIVSLLWGFVGYSFSQRYLKLNVLGSIITGLIMIVVVIQIERQIILTSGQNLTAKIFRIIIALVMAVIGSVIIDQIVFKEDVDKLKLSRIQSDVDAILVSKTAELNKQITSLDTIIQKKQKERDEVWKEISGNPTIITLVREKRNIKTTVRLPDGILKDTIVVKIDLISKEIPNPKNEYLAQLDIQIREQTDKKMAKQNDLINIRQNLEDELKSKTGFLDELTTLFDILLSRGIALFVWICLFVFFLSIELFVLVTKLSDKLNAYSIIIQHEDTIKRQKVEKSYVQ